MKKRKVMRIIDMSAVGSVGVRNAFGYLMTDELVVLKQVISELPPKAVCINIGAGSGTSGLAFIEDENIGQLYTVDLYRQVRPEGGLGNEMEAFKTSGYGDDKRYHQICGDSTTVGKEWTKGMVDMVFVDGDHSYEHCKSDIEAWLPHIKSGGIMALHDYEKDVWPGVARAVEETISQYKIIAKTSNFIAFRIT